MNYDNNNYNSGYDQNNYNGYTGYNGMQQPITGYNPNGMNQMDPNAAPQGNVYDFSNDLKQTNNGYSNNNASYRKSKGGGGGFFAFLEFLIIVFLVLFIANQRGFVNIGFLDKLDEMIPTKEEKKETKTDTDEDKDKVEIKEQTLTETSLKNELQKKVTYLSHIGVSYNNTIGTFFSKDMTITDISEQDKIQALALATRNIDNSFTAVIDEVEFATILPEGDTTQMNRLLSAPADTLATKYTGIFGGNITNMNVTSSCPSVIYSSNYSKYYLNTFCTDDIVKSTNMLHLYIYNYTKDSGHNYVYVSVGVSKASSNVEDPSTTYTIYKDYQMTKEYKTITQAEFDKFAIDDKTFEQFDKYKITFKENDKGIFVFDNIKKINE